MTRPSRRPMPAAASPLAPAPPERAARARREVLLGLAAAPLAALWPAAARADLSGTPLTLGVEGAIAISGLAERIRLTVGRELGLVVQIVPGPSLDLLARLEAGALNAALTQAPLREAVLDREGLTHTRKLVAMGSHVIVGPAADPAGLKGQTDVLAALDRIVQHGQQLGAGQAAWVRQGEASGTQELEGSLWKALGPRPIGPWMRAATAGARAALDMAAQQGAYTLVERGLWLASPRPALKLWVEGDARLATPCHIALPFRSRHAAAKLLASWLAMPAGQKMVGGFGRGYSAVKG